MRHDVKISVSFAWWLKPYMHALFICALLSNRVPDESKLAAKMRRAMRVHVR